MILSHGSGFEHEFRMMYVDDDLEDSPPSQSSVKSGQLRQRQPQSEANGRLTSSVAASGINPRVDPLVARMRDIVQGDYRTSQSDQQQANSERPINQGKSSSDSLNNQNESKTSIDSAQPHSRHSRSACNKHHHHHHHLHQHTRPDVSQEAQRDVKPNSQQQPHHHHHHHHRHNVGNRHSVQPHHHHSHYSHHSHHQYHQTKRNNNSQRPSMVRIEQASTNVDGCQKQAANESKSSASSGSSSMLQQDRAGKPPDTTEQVVVRQSERRVSSTDVNEDCGHHRKHHQYHNHHHHHHHHHNHQSMQQGEGHAHQHHHHCHHRTHKKRLVLHTSGDHTVADKSKPISDPKLPGDNEQPKSGIESKPATDVDRAPLGDLAGHSNLSECCPHHYNHGHRHQCGDELKLSKQHHHSQTMHHQKEQITIDDNEHHLKSHHHHYHRHHGHHHHHGHNHGHHQHHHNHHQGRQRHHRAKQKSLSKTNIEEQSNQQIIQHDHHEDKNIVDECLRVRSTNPTAPLNDEIVTRELQEATESEMNLDHEEIASTKAEDTGPNEIVKMEMSPNNERKQSKLIEDRIVTTPESNLITSIEVVSPPIRTNKTTADSEAAKSKDLKGQQHEVHKVREEQGLSDSDYGPQTASSSMGRQLNGRDSGRGLTNNEDSQKENHGTNDDRKLIRHTSSSDGSRKSQKNNLGASNDGDQGGDSKRQQPQPNEFSPLQTSSSYQQTNQQRQMTTESNLPLDRRCRLCWCCCCPCSALSNRGSTVRIETLKPAIEPDDSPNNKCSSLPNVPLEEIRAWGDSFDRLMKCSDGRKVFQDFLRCEYSEENILFWTACEELKAEKDSRNIAAKARDIYEDYISILSSKEVSLDSRVRDIINNNIKKPTSNIFDEAQLQIYTLMHRDSYPRFINSPMYKKLAQIQPSSRKSSS